MSCREPLRPVPPRVAAAVGITAQNLSVLKTGKDSAIRFSTLDALCRTLDCQPADLIEYRDEAVSGQTVEPTRPS
ncbi:MAG: helix-turn-helix transcriptional regulator [Gammaproteobacteria bacterium]|nr:helix-turn-helix transcriptional regulator [Gammaproteobacteria bacterium]